MATAVLEQFKHVMRGAQTVPSSLICEGLGDGLPLRIAFASGGTGGHLYPGLAIAGVLSQANSASRCLFLISEKPVEANIVRTTDYPFAVIPSCPPGFRRGWPFCRKLLEGYRRAKAVLRDFKPHALVVLGGFASFAPALAARRMGIPLFVQEQNCVAGRANVVLSLLAKEVFVPFDGMGKQFPFARVLKVGPPVRPCAMSFDRETSLRALGLAQGKFTLLVLGGSQGARFLNTLVERALERMGDFAASLQWIHLTGPNDADAMRDAYARGGWGAAVFPFFERMGICYGACDLVVCRAGASTMAEIIANGLASVLIPYPAALRDHQKKNAQVLSEKGAAILLDQALLTPAAFATVVRSLQRDTNRLVRMRQAVKRLGVTDAAGAIAKELSRFISRAGNAG